MVAPQTVKFLREGKMEISRGVFLHVILISAPLRRYDAEWPTVPNVDGAPSADDRPSATKAPADSSDVASSGESRTAAMRKRSGATADMERVKRPLSPEELKEVRSSLEKQIEKLVSRTKKNSPSTEPLPAYGAVFHSDDVNSGRSDGADVGDAANAGDSLSDSEDEANNDLGVVGNAAWRELPLLIREAMPNAPAHQRTLMQSWALTQFFQPLYKRLMNNREANEQDVIFAAQLRKLSFLEMENLGIDEQVRESASPRCRARLIARGSTPRASCGRPPSTSWRRSTA